MTELYIGMAQKRSKNVIHYGGGGCFLLLKLMTMLSLTLCYLFFKEILFYDLFLKIIEIDQQQITFIFFWSLCWQIVCYLSCEFSAKTFANLICLDMFFYFFENIQGNKK